MFSTSLADLIAALGGDLTGASETRIARIGPLEGADGATISFLANPRYQSQLACCTAACVIVAPAMAELAAQRGGAYIVTPDPYLYFARLTRWWAAQTRPAAVAGVHASACVDPSAQLGEGVEIGPLAVIEAGAVIGDGARIGAHCVVERNARVGAGTRLAPRVVLGYDCCIGARGIVHSGAVIGADGFGFAPHQGQWEKIAQLGAVQIGDDVEIGANTCIDRGALDDTVIEDGVKLDNLIQIGHNVRIGAHTAIAGCVAVAGSTRIGAHCTVGGAASIVGHLVIADKVHISACTLITRSISKPGLYTGVFPFDDNASWEKNAATLRQLHALRDRVRTLEKKVVLKNTMDIHQILKKLPHRYPILLVDRVLELEKGKRIRALKNVSINEPYFLGHFPHRPVMPGVLMLEALAQAATVLALVSTDTELDDKSVVYFAGIDNARFKRPVEPGDQLFLDVTLDRAKAGIVKFSGRVLVGEELAAEAQLMCTMRRIEG